MLQITDENPFILLAVIGELRNSSINHTIFLKHKSKLLGEHKTEPLFEMLHFGKFPVIAKGKSSITCDIYRISSQRVLDNLLKLGEFCGDPQEIKTKYGRAYIHVVPAYPSTGQTLTIKSGDWNKKPLLYNKRITQ